MTRSDHDRRWQVALPTEVWIMSGDRKKGHRLGAREVFTKELEGWVSPGK